jgi:hypothetical protein
LPEKRLFIFFCNCKYVFMVYCKLFQSLGREILFGFEGFILSNVATGRYGRERERHAAKVNGQASNPGGWTRP